MVRASFTTLPLELKAKIVEMTSDQETSYQQRVVGAERVGHINCLSSLALVNKELRGLAAKHQFKVLLSGRASLRIFRFRILPLYGHHITEIQLSGKQGIEPLEVILLIIGQLPALRALRLTKVSARLLFGPGITLLGDEEVVYRAGMLASIASKIESLTLWNFLPAETVALVRTFPNLKTLYLMSLEAFGDVEELEGLTSSLAGLCHLTHLIVDLPDDSERGWPTEAFGPLKRNPPPLQTLQLLWFPLDHHTLNFIELFSPTLETLCLGLGATEPEPDLSARDPLQLPLLTSFNLYFDGTPLKDAFRLLTSYSTLSHVSLDDANLNFEPTDPTLLSFLASQPTIHSLHLGHCVSVSPVIGFDGGHHFPPSYLAAYADLIHSHGLDPTVLDRPHLTPFHPKANLDYTENEGEYLAEILDRTLDFGIPS